MNNDLEVVATTLIKSARENGMHQILTAIAQDGELPFDVRIALIKRLGKRFGIKTVAD